MNTLHKVFMRHDFAPAPRTIEGYRPDDGYYSPRAIRWRKIKAALIPAFRLATGLTGVIVVLTLLHFIYLV